jgi:integrase
VVSDDLTRVFPQRSFAGYKRGAGRLPNVQINLAILRLACRCGRRAIEIAQLQIADVRVEPARPHLRIRCGAARGGKSRIVPLWWDKVLGPERLESATTIPLIY